MELRIKGLGQHLKKLKSMQATASEMDGVLGATALLVQGEIQRIITSEIAPHSRRGQVVTDLVDTGFLRQNWQTTQLGALRWQVATNTQYAPILEYGYKGDVTVRPHTRKTKRGGSAKVKGHKRKVNRRGYFFVRRAKAKAPELLKERVLDLIKRKAGA